MPEDQPQPTISEIAAKGGKARALALTPERRREIAVKAIEARHSKSVPQAISDQGEIKIGDSISIPCAVLEGEVRVVTQRGVSVALGRHKNPTKGASSIDERPAFLAANNLDPFIPEELRRSWNPVRFRFREGSGGYQGNIAFGYRAEIIPQVCRVWLDADAAGALRQNQKRTAAAARMLLAALGTVGIIALVDEATGYQEQRAKNALAKILERFVAAELRPYIPCFPLDYLKEMCRLRGVEFSPTMRLPRYFGHLTNDLVYRRLAPGVFEEIRRKNPAANGRRKSKHFQWLTGDVGHPKLLQHLGSIVTLMKLASTWDELKANVDRFHPVWRDMPLFKGLEGFDG